jgi:DNA-binding response OmpR family regulator
MLMTEKKRILIVDDDESIRTLLSAQLTGQGYEVSSVDGGGVAIETLGSQSYDVILLDIQMPTVDGFEVLKYAKEKQPATKVIMLSGFADMKNMIVAKQLGADQFVSKPYEFTELLSALQAVLGET